MRRRAVVALGRAHLRYGEWLCRQNRHAATRLQQRTAYQMLASMRPRRSPNAPPRAGRDRGDGPQAHQADSWRAHRAGAAAPASDHPGGAPRSGPRT